MQLIAVVSLVSRQNWKHGSKQTGRCGKKGVECRREGGAEPHITATGYSIYVAGVFACFVCF